MLRSVEPTGTFSGNRSPGNPDSQLRHGAPVKKGDRAEYVCLPASKGRNLARSGIS